jgi:hypothetical protein
MTPEQFSRLPKWAQEKITTLQHQLDDTVKALNAAVSQSLFDRVCSSLSPTPPHL